ncbi:1,3-beta-glucanosyltransferase [Mycena amicta]|nr:1,3-beta-glucanosyltransferase [Mycena amicta]
MVGTLKALLAAAFLTSVAALPKITRTGRYLYSQDGTRFLVKGVAYQGPGYTPPGQTQPTTFTDILADPAGCTRDLPMFQQLGINTIRTYSVNSSLDHDGCMETLENAGIYLVLDLALPLGGSIETGSIATGFPFWSTDLLDQYIETINVFTRYNNILAFSVGNEVVAINATGAAPFVKAAARDVKAYLTSISSSALVSYAAKDESSPDILAEYLSCDPSGTGSGDSSIDMLGLNNYEWCGAAPTNTYDTINSQFKDYNVVAYFSEYGGEDCNPSSRPWTEVGTIFSSAMTDTWSGGIAFSYFPAESGGHNYGMVTLSPDNKTVVPSQDFTNLVSQYAKVDLGSLNSPAQGSVKASAFGACPGPSANLTASTKLPPTPDDSVCGCIASKLSCVFTTKPGDGDVVSSGLVGSQLTAEVCGMLGNCNDIANNGATGTYGSMTMCDPITRLSYAFSQYYEAHNRSAANCFWNGNGKVTTGSLTAAQAVSACAAKDHAAVFTATAPSGASTAVKNSPTDTSEPSGVSSAGGSTQTSGGGGSGGGAGKSNIARAQATFGKGVGLLAILLAGAGWLGIW